MVERNYFPVTLFNTIWNDRFNDSSPVQESLTVGVEEFLLHIDNPFYPLKTKDLITQAHTIPCRTHSVGS